MPRREGGSVDTALVSNKQGRVVFPYRKDLSERCELDVRHGFETAMMFNESAGVECVGQIRQLRGRQRKLMVTT